MRRLVVLLTATASLVLGAGGPVAAAPPDKPFDHDCRVGLACHPGQHEGWPEGQLLPERRNLGG